MDYNPRIELGQILQTVGSLIAATGVCVFAYTMLLGDVNSTKEQVKDTKKAVVAEARERKENDTRLQQEIKEVETRQRFLLEDIRDDVKFLVRERRDGQPTSSK